MNTCTELLRNGPVIAVLGGGAADSSVVERASALASLSNLRRLTLLAAGGLPSSPLAVPDEVRVERRSVPSDPAGAAIAEAEKGEATLIVASAASAYARRLFRRAPCPLLLLPAAFRGDGDGPVLVSVDFSAESERAARFAAGVGRPVELLHIYRVPLGWHRLGWTYVEFASRMEARCRKDMDAFVARLETPPAAARVELGGDVAATLLEAVRFRPASAVVLASRRRTAAASLVRSAGETVALGAAAPVWVLRNAVENTFLDVLG